MKNAYLLFKESLGFHNSVVQVDKSSVLFGLEIQVIKELNKSFVELSNFDIWWTVLDFSLNNCNTFVLISDKFPLIHKFALLLIEFLIYLSEHLWVFFFFKFFSSIFHFF